MASISGLSNAMPIAVINSAAHETAADGLNTQKFFLFLIAIIIYVLTQRYILRVSTVEVAKIRISLSDLSTGQNKRLALIVSLLEDKPIYVFDEWAADQDPSFRKFFTTPCCRT